MQRNIIIVILAIVVLGLGVFAYFYFFTGSSGIAVAPTGTTSLPLAGQVPSSASGKTTQSTTPIISSPGTPIVVSSRLVQISTGPVVPGVAVTDSKATLASSSPTVATIRYIERQSGNVFSYRADTHALTRINNKTIPGIQSAAWLPDGSTALVRYLSGTDFSTINTYAQSASSSSGFFLPQNLMDVAVSASGLLTLASGVNGSIVSLSHTDGTHASALFTTPLTSLRISFSGKNQYLVTTKPSSSLEGDAFLVSATGRFSRIAGPLFGLVALASPSGKWILVSYVQNSLMRMELVNTSTGVPLLLPIATVADKCVWAADETSVFCGIPQNPPSASYPDDWYQGAVQFSDRIWDIHTTDRYAQMVLDFSQTNKGALDTVGLAIDPAKTALVFMNKNDGSLWSYSL